VRILHVLSERGFSGGENQLLATLRFLASRGHQQELVLDDRAQFKDAARKLGIEFRELRFRNNLDPIAATKLRGIYKESRPDLIHLACSRSHKIGALAGVFGAGLPPKVAVRRMDYPIVNSPLRRWMYGKAVDRVVAISSGVRDAVLEIGVDPSRIELIHEGVDTARFGELREPENRAAARQRLGLADTDFFGVTTASLHVRKAHDVLLDALGTVEVPEGRKVVWLFGGDGPERQRLRARAATLPDSVEVRIPGQIDYVDDALAAADAFCLPSRYEGLGVALLEALSTGVPCIASEVGGMKDVLVSGESGIHVQPEDVTGLAAAIQGLLDDPQLCADLGAAGKRRAEDQFDIEFMGQKTEALYLELIRQAKSSSASRGS
jgi:glycosyltransferase involved in cell wall biosynthesis